MKTKRIPLYNWKRNNTDFIEIDWPVVHRVVGADLIEWSLRQSETNCQLVVDKVRENFTLVLEIYNEKTLALYHLMWAK